MGTFKVIPKELKEQIISRIKNEGVSVSTAASEHGISTKTIYNWLNQGFTGQPVSYREYAKVKRENQTLLAIIGQLTLETKKLKKN